MQTTGTRTAMGCLLMAMASSAANAQNTAFRLVNNTQFIVSEVYFWPVGDDERGPDRLGMSVLGSGETVDFGDDEGSRCRYNVLVIPRDPSNRRQWNNLNLCEVSTFTLDYNYTQRELTSSTNQNSCERYASED